MIISCPECTTRFNLDEERIPQAGAKVRCARCKHIFMVQKPPEKQILETTEEDVFVADQEATADQEPGPDPTSSDSASRKSDAAPDAGADFSGVDTADNDFDYDRFRELDAAQATPEEFTFGNEEEELAPAPAEKATTAPNVTSTTATSEAEQDEAKELAPEPSRKKKQTLAPKNSAFSILIKAMLLIILAALIAGGVLLYFDGPEEINEKFRQLFGQVVDDATEIGQISLGTLEGKFLTNEQTGEIFVIRGETINNFNQPRSAIQVKGVLHDQQGRPLLQMTVFSGNPINDEELRSLPYEEIEQRMGNQFGKDLSNMKIDPRRSIPFAIVFKDLPQNIAEFSVKVTASRPTAN